MSPTATHPSSGSQLATVKSLLSMEGYKKRFEEVLGKKAASFLASITNAAQMPHLAVCEPKSVIASAFVAATLDLPIDKNLGFAHLVPYKDKGKSICQFQMGYKGFMQLAFRTGQYRHFNDCVIPAGVFVSHNELTGELVLDWSKHDHTKDNEAPAGYAVFWRTNQGFEKTVYWSLAKVEAHARRFSKSFGKDSSPWTTQFNAMALKTVIKAALSKYGIMSIEMQGAIIHDQGAQADIGETVTHPDSALFGEAVEEETDTPSDGIKKADAPVEGTNPDLEEQKPEVPFTASPERTAVVADIMRLMEQHKASEAAILAYAIKGKMLQPGDELFSGATPTEVLAKLRFAIPALKNTAKAAT